MKMRFTLNYTKWLKNSLFLITLCVFLTRCTSTETPDTTLLRELFARLGIKFPKDKKTIIVQSKFGCHTCFDIVTDYINKKHSSNNIIFIIPFTTQKEINIQFPKDVLGSENVIIDKYNDAIQLGVISENSIIFFLENNQVSRQIILTPDNIDYELKHLK